MSKLCLMINNIDELKLKVDSVILGIKNYNNLNILEVTIDDLKQIKTEKEIFVSINKPIHDYEINELKKILIDLSNINISGVLFDDISIYQISKEENLNLNLIWANIHQTTNYNTINVWNKLGVKNVFISPDITLKEIENIKKNSNSNIFVPIYGMFDIFTSNRFLLTNYLKYINQEKENSNYYIENNDIKYPIYENKNGTHIINGNIVNGLDESVKLMDINVEYLIINSYMLNNLNKIIDNFNTVKKMFIDKNISIDKIKQLSSELNNDYKGFLYNETIYKVKSDEDE